MELAASWQRDVSACAGEESTISYAQLHELRPERRATLRECYFFDIDPGAPTAPPEPLMICSLPGPRSAGRGPPVVNGVVVRVYEEPPWPLDPDAQEITAVLGAHPPIMAPRAVHCLARNGHCSAAQGELTVRLTHSHRVA